MKILAIETSALVASAALVDGDKLIGEFTINYKLTHSQTIMPMIDSLLKIIDFDIKDVDYIACSAGPGSFTGLRIGSATAKGLALGINKPIVPVSTLEALAYNIYDTDKMICPIMDARRSQVYTGVYEWKNGEMIEVLPPEALSIEEIIDKTLAYKREVIFLGDGVSVHKEKLAEHKEFLFAPPNCNMQSAASVAALAQKLVAENKAVEGSKFMPIYLRKPQAERERDEKLLSEDTNV